MKRLNFILLAGLSLVAAVSCNKQMDPVEEPEVKAGVPMTLTATIGGTDTKLGFTKDGNALKGTWNANEKISVVSYNGYGLVAVNTFTTGSESEGQTTADFTGTYTGGSESSIVVIYPAMESYINEEEIAYYGTPLPDGAVSSNARLINSLKGNLTYEINTNSSTQSANGSVNHLGDYSFLMGNGTVSGNNLTVTLNPQTAVFRITITLDDSYIGKELYSMSGTVYRSDVDPYYWISNYGELDYSLQFTDAACTFNVNFGSWGSAQVPITLTSSDLTFVAYVPFVPYPDPYRTGHGNRIGTDGAKKIDFAIELGGGIGWIHKPINLTKDKTLEPGKVYDIAVTMPTVS